MMNPQPYYGIQSTAGAVPVRNEKGEISMQKVKVHRYVSGKKPDYAQDARSSSDSDDDDFLERRNQPQQPPTPEPSRSDDELNDPRLRRLKIAEVETEVRPERRRHVVEPEVLESSDEESEKEQINLPEHKHTLEAAPDDDESEVELSDSEIEKRREMMKKRMMEKQEEEFMVKEEEKSESSEESSEYEEYTDSEEETGPRLKPIFVRKKDRITIIEKEKEVQKQKQQELEAVRNAEERRRQTLRLVEETIRKEQQQKDKENNEPNLNDVCTDDENDEIEYEAWKLRELKRIKRDREEREAIEKERLEVERLRNMTEEERRLELRLNPKQVTNKAIKGKYKFLQKYYHRGAFYLDKEDEVFKRDFAQATLEDHFDKTILPKVMQVKNFGRSGRTKYTHLVDQDTTHFDSPWSSETSQNLKFHSTQAGGVKQVFEKPSLKKRKTQ
ncbi:microfibrillar-associated protein 1 [Tribolium castaneum]|uniref:Microfibrillar-associated protein 1-like Protein n=1 Tax=Tribolium castaneum TaxID=7070 RepID=D6WA67_TRICA|nr:PREDICTED: microfibrillar-associated protein 1 [Tribolium castaneum]EEZ98051.1 Microfibrillar-associated protein 1-like Protein [Tribolium castaneum]|eukprot:XP_969609.1 PREDICTED: microfibrillar-associated protein 1 [Tribolium castaneum]